MTCTACQTRLRPMTPWLAAVLSIRLAVAPLNGQPRPRPDLPQGAAPAIKLTVREGEGALNNIRVRRAKEPVVVVTDAAGQPVANATVMFLLPDLGAGGMFPATGNVLTVTTGEDGVAVGRGLKPNNIPGPFEIRVVASYGGQTARAVIHQTNVASAPSGGGGKTAWIVALVGGAGAAVALGVTRSSAKATPAAAPPAAAPVGTVISVGGSSFGPP